MMQGTTGRRWHERGAKGRTNGTSWLTGYERKRADESRVTPSLLRA